MALVSLFKIKDMIPFMSWHKIALVASAVAIAASLGLAATIGLNLGVDFKGGINFVVKTTPQTEVSDLRSKLNALDLGDVGLQSFGSTGDSYLIRLAHQADSADQSEGQADQLAAQSVKTALSDNIVEILSSEIVGPTVSGELFKAGLYAALFSLLGIAAYIAMRFEWRFAMAALVALLHDVITTIGFLSLFQIEFNLATVAAILTIAGYSINDTVVVFDRVREEMRRRSNTDFLEVLNIALNITLSRTLVTSLTTLLALLALALFGGPVIFGFSLALIWGVMIGTYSSVLVATPLLIFFKVRADSLEKKDNPSDDGEAELKARMRAVSQD